MSSTLLLAGGFAHPEGRNTRASEGRRNTLRNKGKNGVGSGHTAIAAAWRIGPASNAGAQAAIAWEKSARQAAARALKPCMMVRLMSISGSNGMAWAMTCEE